MNRRVQYNRRSATCQPALQMLTTGASLLTPVAQGSTDLLLVDEISPEKRVQQDECVVIPGYGGAFGAPNKSVLP
jgi:hypothetical protein